MAEEGRTAEAARRTEGEGAGPDALRVGVLAYPGCFASEVFGVPDLLTMAGHVAGPDAPGYRVSVLSPRRRVTASGGTRLDVRPP
ncbi:AraC family transcriptional regulator, partial [Streptomyces katrae]